MSYRKDPTCPRGRETFTGGQGGGASDGEYDAATLMFAHERESPRFKISRVEGSGVGSSIGVGNLDEVTGASAEKTVRVAAAGVGVERGACIPSAGGDGSTATSFVALDLREKKGILARRASTGPIARREPSSIYCASSCLG